MESIPTCCSNLQDCGLLWETQQSTPNFWRLGRPIVTIVVSANFADWHHWHPQMLLQPAQFSWLSPHFTRTKYQRGTETKPPISHLAILRIKQVALISNGCKQHSWCWKNMFKQKLKQTQSFAGSSWNSIFFSDWLELKFHFFWLLKSWKVCKITSQLKGLLQLNDLHRHVRIGLRARHHLGLEVWTDPAGNLCQIPACRWPRGCDVIPTKPWAKRKISGGAYFHQWNGGENAGLHHFNLPGLHKARSTGIPVILEALAHNAPSIRSMFNTYYWHNCYKP